jgi:hypothetical protein
MQKEIRSKRLNALDSELPGADRYRGDGWWTSASLEYLRNPMMPSVMVKDDISASTFELRVVDAGRRRQVALRISGGRFEEIGDDSRSAERHDYGNAIVAIAAFEHRLSCLLASGYSTVAPASSPYADVEALIEEEPDEPEGDLLLAEALRAIGDPRGELIEVMVARLREDSPALREREDELLRIHGARLFGALEELVHAIHGTFRFERSFGFAREAWVADADLVALADVFEPPLLRADPRDLGFDPRTSRLAPHTYAAHALRRLLVHPAGRFLKRLRLEVNASLEPLVRLASEHGRIMAITHLA